MSIDARRQAQLVQGARTATATQLVEVENGARFQCRMISKENRPSR